MTIADVDWLSGRWVGRHGPDEIEETWSPRNGVAMVGMFRAIRDGVPRFYELLTLDTDDGTVVFRFKHFDRSLIGWEERDEVLTWTLERADAFGARFRRLNEAQWMTYRRDTPDGLRVSFEREGTRPDPDDDFVFARR